jgi:hypothetical protein
MACWERWASPAKIKQTSTACRTGSRRVGTPVSCKHPAGTSSAPLDRRRGDQTIAAGRPSQREGGRPGAERLRVEYDPRDALTNAGGRQEARIVLLAPPLT